MKSLIINISIITFLAFSFSCEDYLDKAPESDLTINEVFKDFQNAQGFVEEMYMYIVDYALGGHYQTFFCLGDDSDGRTTYLMDHYIDMGTFRFWYDNKFNYFAGRNDGGTTTGSSVNNAFNRPGIWEGWEAIRKANITIDAIENQQLMVDATQAERELILGQAYFFRAFFHHEIMKFWGRIPYVDKVLSGEDTKDFVRPATYEECALKADADFAWAAELLPNDWDEHPAGQKTLGENMGRVTKGAAYAFKGKNLLLAASPLMQGNTNTYAYNVELCQQATDAFAEVLKLTDESYYSLQPFINYNDVFYTVGGAKKWPGGTEFIFNNPSASIYTSRQIPAMFALIDNAGSAGHVMSPTHNYIHSNFGMADGLSCEDSPLYDPNNPFSGRDPRFYAWVTVDGDPLVSNTAGVPAVDQTAKLFVGGEHRFPGGIEAASNTGYICKKYYPIEFNKYDKVNSVVAWRLHMRLTDVYLMYAEAAHVAYGATAAPGSYALSAEGAINLLRDRTGIPHVDVQYLSDFNGFMDEIRRERAVELSWEAHRWVDIRRWSLAHLDKYKQKVALEFDAAHSYFQEVIIEERVCEYPKHFWLPFEQDQTEFFEGFEQNPGW